MSKVVPSALLAFFALILLFFKLPGIAVCKSCVMHSPYLPMLGAAYFSALLVIILSFPILPTPLFKFGGSVWAVGLGLTFTYLSSEWCWLCIGAHFCHLLLWILWKPTSKGATRFLGLKLSLVFSSALAAAALFSTLNLTFLVYGFHKKNHLVKKGSLIPDFALQTLDKQEISNHQNQAMILNFVSSNCPFCKEQLPELDKVAQIYQKQGIRFISLVPKVTPDLQKLAPHLEWAEDQEGRLAEKFGIEGYPTLIFVDTKGRVNKTVAGLPSKFDQEISKQLIGLK